MWQTLEESFNFKLLQTEICVKAFQIILTPLVCSNHHQFIDSATMKERFFNAGTQNADDVRDQTNRLLQNEAKVQANANASKAAPPATSIRQCHGSTENLAFKPDKPPRPAMPVVESQTLVRNQFKAKGLDRHGRPVALPRNILNVARSTENLSSASSSSPVKTSPGTIIPLHRNDTDDEAVILRDALASAINSPAEHTRPDKPAIPERPTSLMKPSYRTAVFDKFDAHQSFHSQPLQPDSPHGIKKTQSFRLSSSPAQNGQKGASLGSISGRSLTTLERTHVYNVDKQKVEIIDVSDQPNGQNNGAAQQNAAKPPPVPVNDSKEVVNTAISVDESKSNAQSTVAEKDAQLTTENVSPRCFEPKVIKRPQIPAPPPPKLQPNTSADTNQGNECVSRKSDGSIAADSTNL